MAKNIHTFLKLFFISFFLILFSFSSAYSQQKPIKISANSLKALNQAVKSAKFKSFFWVMKLGSISLEYKITGKKVSQALMHEGLEDFITYSGTLYKVNTKKVKVASATAIIRIYVGLKNTSNSIYSITGTFSTGGGDQFSFNNNPGSLKEFVANPALPKSQVTSASAETSLVNINVAFGVTQSLAQALGSNWESQVRNAFNSVRAIFAPLITFNLINIFQIGNIPPVNGEAALIAELAKISSIFNGFSNIRFTIAVLGLANFGLPNDKGSLCQGPGVLNARIFSDWIKSIEYLPNGIIRALFGVANEKYSVSFGNAVSTNPLSLHATPDARAIDFRTYQGSADFIASEFLKKAGSCLGGGVSYLPKAYASINGGAFVEIVNGILKLSSSSSPTTILIRITSGIPYASLVGPNFDLNKFALGLDVAGARHLVGSASVVSDGFNDKNVYEKIIKIFINPGDFLGYSFLRIRFTPQYAGTEFAYHNIITSSVEITNNGSSSSPLPKPSTSPTPKPPIVKPPVVNPVQGKVAFVNPNLQVLNLLFNKPFSYKIAASGSIASWSATGLPIGMSIVNGVLSGTVARRGIFNVIITISNATRTMSVSKNIRLVVR